MGDTKETERLRVIGRLEVALRRRSSPRLLMFFLVLGTATAGFVASAGLLRLGIEKMWLRYGLSVVVAYAAFMFLVFLWILYRRRRLDTSDRSDDTDVSFGEQHKGDDDLPGNVEVSPADGNFSVDFEVDEGIVFLPFVLAIGCAVIAALYLVYTAPPLFAELLLDGVVGAALYRRLRRMNRKHWLESAYAHTRLPLFFTVAVFIIAGAVLQVYAPEATSLGGVWQHYLAHRR